MEAKEILALGGGLVLGSIAIGPVARMVGGSDPSSTAMWSGAAVAAIGLGLNHYAKTGIKADLAVGAVLAGGLVFTSGVLVKFMPPPASKQAAGALPHRVLHALHAGGASAVEMSATQKIAAWQRQNPLTRHR